VKVTVLYFGKSNLGHNTCLNEYVVDKLWIHWFCRFFKKYLSFCILLLRSTALLGKSCLEILRKSEELNQNWPAFVNHFDMVFGPVGTHDAIGSKKGFW